MASNWTLDAGIWGHAFIYGHKIGLLHACFRYTASVWPRVFVARLTSNGSNNRYFHIFHYPWLSCTMKRIGNFLIKLYANVCCSTIWRTERCYHRVIKRWTLLLLQLQILNFHWTRSCEKIRFFWQHYWAYTVSIFLFFDNDRWQGWKLEVTSTTSFYFRRGAVRSFNWPRRSCSKTWSCAKGIIEYFDLTALSLFHTALWVIAWCILMAMLYFCYCSCSFVGRVNWKSERPFSLYSWLVRSLL